MKYRIALIAGLLGVAIYTGAMFYTLRRQEAKAYNTWYQLELRPSVVLDIRRIARLPGTDIKQASVLCLKDPITPQEVNSCLEELDHQVALASEARQ